MNALSFVLAVGAFAVPVAWLVSAATLLLVPLVRRLSPVARTEAATWVGLLPALVAGALVVAVSAPSVLYGLGLGPDHCLGHEHHVHVCFWHGAILPSWLALVGAVGWAAAAVRLGQVLSRLAHAERLGAQLCGVASNRDGVHVVPAAVVVCHAVGLVRPRVIVSERVVDELPSQELAAAIAHERAHVDRSDPLWAAVLDLVGALAPLTSGRWASLFREAAEETADDVAAGMTDGPTAASALVSVARLKVVPMAGFALVSGALERRVARLLDGTAVPRKSRIAFGAALLGLAGAAVIVGAHGHLHHLVEETWHLAIGG